MRVSKEQWAKFFDESPYWLEISKFLRDELDRIHKDLERAPAESVGQISALQREAFVIRKFLDDNFKEKLFNHGK